MKCSECGAEVSDEGIEYCPKCGIRVKRIHGGNYAKASLTCASIGFIIFLFYAIPCAILILFDLDVFGGVFIFI